MTLEVSINNVMNRLYFKAINNKARTEKVDVFHCNILFRKICCSLKVKYLFPGCRFKITMHLFLHEFYEFLKTKFTIYHIFIFDVFFKIKFICQIIIL